jgi:hypothetical protein
MTQDEFFARLAAALGPDAGRPEMAELLDDFRTHFAEALAQGLSEQDVAAKLGDPAEIADALREAAPAPPASPASGGFTPGAGQPSPAPAVTPGAGQAESQAAFTTSPAPAGAAKAAKLIVDVKSANVAVHQGGGDRIEVRITRAGQPFSDPRFQIQDLDGVVHVTETGERSWLDYLFWWQQSIKIDVAVPNPVDGAVVVRARAGDLEVAGLVLLGDGSFDTHAGNVRLRDVAAPSLHAASQAGNVETAACEAKLDALTKAGNVEVTRHRGAVQAESRAGNVEVETSVSDAPAILTTRGGNVTARIGVLTAPIRLDTRAGNAEITVDRLEADVEARTNAGNVKARFPAGAVAWFHLNGHDIRNDFDGIKPPQSAPNVTLSTRAGNVKVKSVGTASVLR